MNRQDTPGPDAALRHMMEKRPGPPRGEPGGSARLDDMADLTRDLLARQVALEMQNQELLETRSEIEADAILLAELYDCAPVGYFSVTAQGTIRKLNRTGARMLATECSDAHGRRFADFLTPDCQHAFGNFLTQAFNGGLAATPCEISLAGDGESKTVLSLTGTLSPNGMFCRMAAMDVTEQRRVERLADQRNADLDRIFDLSHDLLAIASSDGHFRRLNPAFERVLGHDRQTLMNCCFLRFVHPDDVEATRAVMTRLLAGEDVMDFVNRYRHADGSYRWLEWRVTPYGDGLMCAVARDITGRRLAEDALRVTEGKFRNIVESSPTALHLYQLTDDGRLVLTEANAAADKELGIDHGRLVGRTIEEAFPNIAGTDFPRLYRAIANGGQGARHFEIQYDEGSVSGCYDVHVFQTAPGTIAVAFTDITERRRILEERRRNQEELEAQVQRRTGQLHKRTSQLRALASQLACAEERERRRIGALIHEDLQQMLGAALLNMGMLKPKAPDKETLEEINRIEGILRDSIQTTRSLSAELSPPVLQQCGLAAALKWLRTWYGEKYALDLTVDVPTTITEPDPDISVSLFRCVREILFNIVKHSGSRHADLRMWNTPDDCLRIAVSDHGVGFDPALVRAREGTGGIGLFGIRERLEHLGGRLEVASSPGHGSSFTLVVPLTPGARPSSGEAS